MIDLNSVIIGEVKNKKFIEVQRAATKGYADCFQRGIKIPARKLLDIKNPFSNARNTLPVKCSSQGYVTTAVVSILAILSLFATRNMIVATVDNFRSAGYYQGLTTSLYAAEVALQDTITEMESRSGLATALGVPEERIESRVQRLCRPELMLEVEGGFPLSNDQGGHG